MNKDKIPQTDSIQELAEFWQTHDLTEFEDQLEEVREPIFSQDTVIHIALQPTEVEAVQQVARSRGVQTNDLVREWVLEKLRAA